jgi:NDP-sugar pyrophosphorylase family protein
MGKEFQVILLAGGIGRRMYPLTQGDHTKHLLPIANR